MCSADRDEPPGLAKILTVLAFALVYVGMILATHTCSKKPEPAGVWYDVPSSVDLHLALNRCIDESGGELTKVKCDIHEDVARNCKVKCDDGDQSP